MAQRDFSITSALNQAWSSLISNLRIYSLLIGIQMAIMAIFVLLFLKLQNFLPTVASWLFFVGFLFFIMLYVPLVLAQLAVIICRGEKPTLANIFIPFRLYASYAMALIGVFFIELGLSFALLVIAALNILPQIDFFFRFSLLDYFFIGNSTTIFTIERSIPYQVVLFLTTLILIRLFFIVFIVADKKPQKIGLITQSWRITKGHTIKLLGVFLLFVLPLILIVQSLQLVGVPELMKFEASFSETLPTWWYFYIYFITYINSLYLAFIFLTYGYIYKQLADKRETDLHHHVQ